MPHCSAEGRDTGSKVSTSNRPCSRTCKTTCELQGRRLVVLFILHFSFLRFKHAFWSHISALILIFVLMSAYGSSMLAWAHILAVFDTYFRSYVHLRFKHAFWAHISAVFDTYFRSYVHLRFKHTIWSHISAVFDTYFHSYMST